MLVEAAIAVGLFEVLFELFLGVTPREVAVRLREAHIAQRAHHARAGERLGKEQHFRMLLRNGGNHILPETHRLGVRIVNAEDRHTRLDPQIHNAFDFLFDAFHVGIEVDRVNVLILLRWILCECDGAVRLGAEPVRMRLDPRMVRRALQSEIKRDFQAQLVGALAECLEIVHGAKLRVNGVVATQFGADAERGARIVRAGYQGIVASLAVGHANWEDRRQIHNVEAFGCGAFQAGDRRLEVAGNDLAVFTVVGSFGTWEELIPGGEAGLRAFHTETLRIRFGQAVAQRVGFVQLLDVAALDCGETLFGAQRLVFHGLGGVAQHLLVGCGKLGILRVSPTCEQLCAGFQRILHVVIHFNLDGGVVQPRLVGVFPAFDHDLPFAQLTLDGGIIGIPRLQIAVFADLDHGFPAVEARIGAGHGETFNLAAACVTHGHGRSCLGAAFDEHLGGDVECFAELHACREQAVLNVRGDVEHVHAAELFGAGAFDDGGWGFADRLRCGGLRFGGALASGGCRGLFGCGGALARRLRRCRCRFGGRAFGGRLLDGWLLGCGGARFRALIFFCHTADYRGEKVDLGELSSDQRFPPFVDNLFTYDW